jgi:hypothetical protein
VRDQDWVKWLRPGYFGRRRDEKVALYNQRYGVDGWKLAWVVNYPEDWEAYGPGTEVWFDFNYACRAFYEESYYQYLASRKDDLDFITSFGECYDNAKTNVESQLDYTKQEAFSTHIQDIAIRNVLNRLDLKFKGPADKLMQIRSSDSDGFKFGPGNVPFVAPKLIAQPSIAPQWANPGSVEDFWQSNKWILIKKELAK